MRWTPSILSLAVLCAGCGSSGGGTTAAPTVPVATISVDAGTVVRTIPRSLYGVNVEWTADGNGVWDPVARAPVPALAQHAAGLGVGPVRFPGGGFADHYHWRDGVGDPASRPMRTNGIDATLYANNFGTAELTEFAAAAGGEALIQANVYTGTASEAGDWVAYCNDAVHAQRQADGHAAPFNVRLWEVGNEQYYNGGAAQLTAAEYAGRYLDFASAMRAADPGITLMAVGGLDFTRYPTLNDAAWNQTLLAAAGPQINVLALHNAYAPVMITDEDAVFEDVYRAMLAFPRHIAQNLRDVDAQIETLSPGNADRMRIAVTEWGPLFQVMNTSRWVDHPKTLGSALYVADAMHAFVTSQRVDIATYFKFSDQVFMGLIDLNHLAKASFYALQMWSKHFGERLVASSASGPTFDAPAVGSLPASTGVPYLDVAASLDAGGTRLYVMVINKHFTDALPTGLQLAGFTPSGAADVWTLTGPAMDANNGDDLLDIPGLTWAEQAHASTGSQFEAGAPGTIAISHGVWAHPRDGAVYTFPARSVTCLEIAGTATAAPPAPVPAPRPPQAVGRR